MSDSIPSSSAKPKLCVMMFLQFFIWGAWYTMVGQYLTKIGMGDSIGWVYTVGPVAALLAPLFLGMVADRFFASQKVLFALMLVGGIAMLLAPSIAQSCADNWAATLKAWDGTLLDGDTGRADSVLMPSSPPPSVLGTLPRPRNFAARDEV